MSPGRLDARIQDDDDRRRAPGGSRCSAPPPVPSRSVVRTTSFVRADASSRQRRACSGDGPSATTTIDVPAGAWARRPAERPLDVRRPVGRDEDDGREARRRGSSRRDGTASARAVADDARPPRRSAGSPARARSPSRGRRSSSRPPRSPRGAGPPPPSRGRRGPRPGRGRATGCLRGFGYRSGTTRRIRRSAARADPTAGGRRRHTCDAFCIPRSRPMPRRPASSILTSVVLAAGCASASPCPVAVRDRRGIPAAVADLERRSVGIADRPVQPAVQPTVQRDRRRPIAAMPPAPARWSDRDRQAARRSPGSSRPREASPPPRRPRRARRRRVH